MSHQDHHRRLEHTAVVMRVDEGLLNHCRVPASRCSLADHDRCQTGAD